MLRPRNPCNGWCRERSCQDVRSAGTAKDRLPSFDWPSLLGRDAEWMGWICTAGAEAHALRCGFAEQCWINRGVRRSNSTTYFAIKSKECWIARGGQHSSWRPTELIAQRYSCILRCWQSSTPADECSHLCTSTASSLFATVFKALLPLSAAIALSQSLKQRSCDQSQDRLES